MRISKETADKLYANGGRVGIEAGKDGTLYWCKAEFSRNVLEKKPETLDELLEQFYKEELQGMMALQYHCEGVSNSSGFNFGGAGGDIQTTGVR